MNKGYLSKQIYNFKVYYLIAYAKIRETQQLFLQSLEVYVIEIVMGPFYALLAINVLDLEKEHMIIEFKNKLINHFKLYVLYIK